MYASTRIPLPLPLPLVCSKIGCLCLSLTVLVAHVHATPEMNDETIRDKVEDELALDPGVNATRIDALAVQGIVTLTGRVNNLLARQRAARIAETVKGVRGVVNRIVVRPTIPRVDADIRADVVAALLDDPATDSYEVTVQVRDGTVILHGTVDSHQERELVALVAKGVRGVTGLDNRVDVDYQSDRPDSEIQREIRQALRWNAYVDDELIQTTVSDGRVALSGTVGSAAEQQLAEADAWVAGVKSVDVSRLKVARWARDEALRGDKYVNKSAGEIQAAIQDALLYDPRVMSFNVDVQVVGSTAILRGTVDNLKARQAAEQDAQHTVGVSFVSNRLKVRLQDPPPDEEIAEKILAAFRRDPYVERFELNTTVHAGTAHLYGAVDSYFEKNHVEDLAARVAGVLEVENHVYVTDPDSPYVYDPYVDGNVVDRDVVLDFERRAPFTPDSQLEAAIEQQLWWSPYVDADQVQVSVQDGIATLTGTVDSWPERQAATKNAYQGGATLVDNDLVVNSD